MGRHDAPLQTQKFSNDLADFTTFTEKWKDFLKESLIVLEATGDYEAALLAHLLEAGLAVHRADPRTASYFIRSLGKRAKTDRLYAYALARYGAERHAELTLARLLDYFLLNYLLTFSLYDYNCGILYATGEKT